ncbi:transcriptional regulator, IclR family [Rhizobiales bacterium GAS191]|nr:transcriptional regulator, IclR family [Rhizobiales bacterium GAS113]SEE30790.1 transcriptional regulator, IclR family [Rhizobiales bacterium GAS191]
MPTYEPVTAILRGLAVLETIAAKGSVAVKDLHAATGLPKSTLVRMLETLIHAGYVYSTGSEPLYALSARSLTLAGGFDQGRRLVSLLGPALREFQSATSWPSDIGIFDRDAMVILETSRHPGSLSVNWQVGSRVTATRSALGRAYLAFLPEAGRRAILATLRELTGEPRDMERFDALLGEVKARGRALNDQEERPGIRSLAAPIFEHATVIASVNISVVADAMSLSELDERYADQVIGLAKRMSALLA